LDLISDLTCRQYRIDRSKFFTPAAVRGSDLSTLETSGQIFDKLSPSHAQLQPVVEKLPGSSAEAGPETNVFFSTPSSPASTHGKLSN
jgi:hypothetical protein